MSVFLAANQIFAADLDGFEFINRDISEILYSVSMVKGIPIVADDTVSGTASFRFAGNDFDSAFDSFLNAERLYVVKSEKKWTVSRINLQNENGLFILDACDIKPSLLLEKISFITGEEITCDSLPETSISIHARGKTVSEIVASVVRHLGEEYSLDADGKLHVKKENIYSFGDAEVDIPMFNISGTSICVGSGREKAKEAADYVTDAVKDDGIYNAMKHFNLI